MRLEPEARAAVMDAIAEAHRELGKGVPARRIAATVITKLHEMEPAGFPWVATYLDDLAIVGAMKACSDWRRAHQTEGRTKKGTASPVPTYAAAKNAAGEVVQMRFEDFDLNAVVAKRKHMETTRNTLSIEVQFLTSVIEIMESGQAESAGEAVEILMGRAS